MDQDEQPQRFKIKPRVYIVGLFALFYLIRNLYTYFTTERPATPPPKIDHYSQQDIEQNQESILFRTRDQMILIGVLLVILFILRRCNSKYEQENPEKQEETEIVKKDKKKKK